MPTVYPRVCGGTGSSFASFSDQRRARRRRINLYRSRGRAYSPYSRHTVTIPKITDTAREYIVSITVSVSFVVSLFAYTYTWPDMGSRASPRSGSRASPRSGSRASTRARTRARARTRTCTVYPRVCGGTNDGAPPRMAMAGLSPRVRGNLSHLSPADRRTGSIPACAGEPTPFFRREDVARVYPRVCGGTSLKARTP